MGHCVLNILTILLKHDEANKSLATCISHMLATWCRTTTKVDGATPMCRYIAGPYYNTFWDLRHHFSDCYMFELHLVQLLVISSIQAKSGDISQSFVDPFNSIQTMEMWKQLQSPFPNYLLSMIPQPICLPELHGTSSDSIVLIRILHIRNSSQASI